MDTAAHVHAPGSIRRAARALRSSARRYPKALLDSILRHDALHVPTQTGLSDRIRQVDPAVAWLGHASILCNLSHLTIAVDPVLSARIGARVGTRTLGLPRLCPPPTGPACLRGVDLVLITHAHFDHLDRPTLEAMGDRGTTVITPPGVDSLIPDAFGRVHVLPAGRSLAVGAIRITAIEPRHWGARAFIDRHRRVNSYIVEAQGLRVLFAGDTAYTESFNRHGPFDLAVFGIGAYNPWVHMHATPEQVVHMADRSGSLRLLPVHHSTFELSDEPIHEPMERLQRSLRPHSTRMIEPRLGSITDLDGRLLSA